MKRALVSLIAIAAAVFAVVLLTGGGDESTRTAGACPAGQRLVSETENETAAGVLVGGPVRESEEERERERDKGEGDKDKGGEHEAGDYESNFRGKCAPVRHPESSRDLAKFTEHASLRQGSDTPAAFAKAVRQKEIVEGAASSIPGTGGSWTPYGNTPLIGDDPTYPTTNGDGFGKINGRVNDFTYAEQNKTLYAAVAQGGVWKSTDLGEKWTSIGDNLPIQSTGSLAYTSAGGGTLIVATGDHAFSNDYAGVGTYWTTDEGKTWHKAAGAPVGALAFRVLVDPNNPEVVYVATGMGLFRSTDAGRSFTNVNLPTGECAGDSSKTNCFFANVVTDVAVQPTDKLGHKGGAVMAAVGWRAGQFPNFNGKPQAPANGLYRSDNGAPNSFQKIPDSAGFTPTERAGRAEFGVTSGPDQNSNVLYAISQDAQLFVEQSGGEADIPLVGTPSVLDAIYVSNDFGKTWEVMQSRNEFFDPSNGSSLSQLTALGIGPGYQVTYNQWIKPDPTRTAPDGSPSRVMLGMEEVWQASSPGGVLPQNGHSRFQVIGAYTANGGACLVVPEQCGQKQEVAGNTTTHPDQQGSVLVPDGKGGVTLVVGNDGGAYTQHADPNQEFDQLRWGDGANVGFHTLLPYGAAMAKDGTVYGGLQDNGQLKILPNGEQHTVYVGDGVFALVDPDNSQIAYDELPNAGINVSTDGGTTWSSIDPNLEDADFVAPMVMDPGDAKHILTGGRDIAETTAGPETTTCKTDPDDPTSCQPSDALPTDWKYVFNLGTMKHPGDPNAEASSDPAKADGTGGEDAPNHATAEALNGANAYVGFCGDCDPVKRHRVFHNGFATNVGGDKPPKIGTGDGWHITAAKGLPNRIITGVTPDPSDPKTVYVTLGASAARYFAPIGSLGEDPAASAGGHVYKSTDAGETFKDISGNLPDVQATWPLVRNKQLIVATAIGVYASAGTNGGKYAPLGDDLPNVAVYQISLKPGDPNTLVAATFGRGVYTYKFADKAGGSSCKDRLAPKTRFSKKAVRAARSKRKLVLSGKVTDRGCKGRKGKVKTVYISVARQVVKTGSQGFKCRELKANGRFRKRGSCHKFHYIKAKRKGSTWKFTSKRPVPRGSYRIRIKSRDVAGNLERPGKKTNTRRIRLR